MTIDFSQIKDWIPIILFFSALFGGAWRISNTLNTTLTKLSNEIEGLHKSFTRSEKDLFAMSTVLDKHDDRIDTHERKIAVLEDRQGRKEDKEGGNR